MPGLVWVQEQMLSSLNALRASWTADRYVGLMQNAGPAQTDWTIANITPATFSGYLGPILLTAWSAAAMVGDRAVTQAAPVQWIHDGGPVNNWITGYYVLDGNGKLAWVEFRDGPAIAMLIAGQPYVVRAKVSLGSRFPIE